MSESPTSETDSPVTIAIGATVEIDGRSAQSLTSTGTTGTLKLEDTPSFTRSISGLPGADAVDTADISPVTIANGTSADIGSPSAQSVTFAGTTGTLKLEDPQAFAGLVSGLSGADAIDLSGFAYGASATATYLGNATGGTLTVTDGSKTARIALSGNYLSSTWTLSSDGKGGTTVVDPTTSADWQDLKVGGGGNVIGIDIDPDGTMVVHTDTNGAYLWNGSQWQQLVTAASMPAAFIAQNPIGAGQGVYEIQMAPSDSSIMYMMFAGYVFRSANKGTTWTQTSFSPVAMSANGGSGGIGQKMAVDPNNPNIVYVGTQANGSWVTTNGGSTWTQISTFPTSTTSNPAAGFIFDPAIGGAVGGVTQTIFGWSNGNGVWESTNGGATWTKLTASGGPTDIEYAAVNSSTGALYVVGDSNTNLYEYANGAWTTLISGNGGQDISSIAINPTNPNEILAVAWSGYINISYNGGSTWSGSCDSSNEPVSTDIPWLAQANTEANGAAFLNVNAVAFNPAQTNTLYYAGGTGVWTTTQVPTSGMTWQTVVQWTDNSVGIENLVANEIIVPPGGDPVLASWDRPFFYISNANAYPSTYGPVNSANIVAGWSIDYASSKPSFLVGIADWWGTEESGYSTNGGQTWTNFATDIPGAGSSFMGGTIAASTPQNIIWAPADGYQPYYTLNGGTTWRPITLPGVTSWSDFDWAYYLTQRSVTADRVLANTFYLYYPGQGVFETTNGGQSWTNVHSGYIESNSSFAGFNSQIQSVPGEASNLFYTGGPQGGSGSTPADEPFYRSTNGGATWAAIPNVLDVVTFGFGAAAAGQSYPAIYIVGYVNNVYGIWQSTNNAQSWTNIGTYPTGELDQITTISGDPNDYGAVYVGFAGGGYAYLPASSGTAPTVTGVTASPATGAEVEGDSITFTVDMSEVVTVAGGAPTLTLNDGGTATYTGGSGTDALTFSYTVASTDSVVSTLAITAVNLPSGVTITDSSGNAANMAGAETSFSGLSVDPPVTVAYYLANQAALDAAGTIAIADTAANVSANIDALNADAQVTAITLTGTGTQTLTLTVAQALDDTQALGAITNASYAIDVIDTPANIAANFDALNADTYVTSIAPIGGGTQTLTLTLAQALNDTRALSILDPFTITVLDTAAGLQALTTTQIADLSNSGVSMLEASDVDAAFTTAQKQALGAAGIALEQPFSGGSVEVINYSPSGVLTSGQYLGIVGKSFTSYTVDYENGEPASASFSNGMTGTFALNADGSYDIAFQNLPASWGFSTFEGVHKTAGVCVARADNMTNGSGDLLLFADGLTVSSSGQLSVTTGADTFPLNAHANETIFATGLNSETFEYATGFGQSAITGLLAGGETSDVIQFNLSMFSSLSSTNTAAQNLADLLSSGAATQSGSNVTITDSAHDVLTLTGVTTSTLIANANSVFRFA